MHVAVCRLTLHIYASRSLKDRRQVVHAVCERLRNKFKIAVAEVGGQDTWQTAAIGIAAVSADGYKARELVERAAAYAQEVAPEAEVTASEIDLFDY
jgi:uncharacterized protein YlxP (DUF503 family)